MFKIVIASKNEGKIREIKEILNLPHVKFLTYKDLNDWPEMRETGKSFAENAILKAKTLVDRFKMAALADDSGLEVDALGGAPGILSARYAGSRCSSEENNAKLLRELGDRPTPQRRAHFRCYAALATPEGKIFVTEGTCEGYIAFEPVGSGGFGYDPIFIPLGRDKTLAELSTQEKNEISHRGQAFTRMRQILEERMGKWL